MLEASAGGIFEPSDIILLSFERELKNKLAEKTKGAQSEESVLKKAFKYFDLNDNGTVEPDEFAKAIEKIGIQIPTKQVSRACNFYTHVTAKVQLQPF